MSLPSIDQLSDTLAYYGVRETNPKADDPISGYHQFSEEQREFLKARKREAAEEVQRIIRQTREQAWNQGVRASGLDLDYALQLLDQNPYRSES